MTALMHKLRQRIRELPNFPNWKNKNWQFNDYFDNQNNAFFAPHINNHHQLNVEYSVLCAQLAADFLRPEVKEEEIIEEIACALIMSDLLISIYRYLHVPREISRLIKDRNVYRSLLRAKGFVFAPDLQEIDEPKTEKLSQLIRLLTIESNWFRLPITRMKKVFDGLEPIIKNIEYSVVLQSINKYANPIVANLAWLFFIPRFLTNIFLLLKHTIPGEWMSPTEKQLDWTFRLKTSISRRWFELGNDSVWIANGLLSCFVLTGTLAPIGIYISVALYAYDIALAVIRAVIEINRIKALQVEYEAIYQTKLSEDASPEELSSIRDFQMHLQERLTFDQKRLSVSIVSTAGLFLAICLTIPYIAALSAVVPFISGLMLVLVTLGTIGAVKIIEKLRPSDKIDQIVLPESQGSNLVRKSFFNHGLQTEQRNSSEEEPELQFILNTS